MTIAKTLWSPAPRMAAFFAAAFFVNGIVLPFFPVLLTARGLTGEEIAFMLAMPFLLRVFSMPVATALADRFGDRRIVVFGLSALILVLALVFGPLSGHAALIGVGTAMLVLSYCVTPLADTIALSMERRGQGDYGRMRLWGSAAFIFGNLVGGVALDRFGVPSIYVLTVTGFMVTLGATLVIPPAGPMPAVAHAASLTILRKPAFLMVLAACAFIQASHAALYGFATLAWQQRGFADGIIGAFWAIGVVAEIVLFAFAAKIPARVSPLTLILSSGLIGFLRWGLFAVETDAVTTALVQVMHAGSFAIGHLGMMRFIRETVPEQRAASAQGTYVIMVGLAMAAATAIAGRLWVHVGDDAFVAMSAFCAVGVVILLGGRASATRLFGPGGASGRAGTADCLSAERSPVPA